jgi:hypothetical protein
VERPSAVLKEDRVLCRRCRRDIGLIDRGELLVAPGYRRDPAGVFRLTRRARDRLAAGQPARSASRYPGTRGDTGVEARTPCCLPAPIECRCGQWQELEPRILGLEARHHTARSARQDDDGRIRTVERGPDDHGGAPRPWPLIATR